MRPLIAVLAAVLAGCAPQPPAPPVPETAFVGRQTCAGCHAQEDRLWQGSHHDLAMQEATEATVLGDFEGATLAHFGTTSTFFRRNERFFVRTDGPDGQPQEFPIAYTFGVSPLQQYLVEMPGGRLQTLPLCWDVEGKRWFHLYSEAVPAGDALHWTGPNQTWNYMCAECHSTGVRKGYQAAENVYETSWSEIDVSCEACHGAGSRHVAWARGGRESHDKGFEIRLKDSGRGTWIADPATGMGKRLAPRVATDEVETCGRCHARRSLIQESQGPTLLDSHRPALLEPGLYHADGQIDGEVYEYGSFLQSRMYHQGVTCSDCHEPHSQTLRRAGNALCTHCHSAPKLDTPDHHKHENVQCVDCHMPEKTYMGVDRRRDHSLRIPRPDLTVEIGSPNACNNCHSDRSPQWAAAKVEGWYGPRKPHWGEALHAGQLAAVATDPEVPGIARATALSRLRSGPENVIESGLRDPDPLVRLGALMAAESLEPEARLRLASPLLTDPVRGVRVEAARRIAGIAGTGAPGLEPALAEYQSAQEANADRPEALLNLGWLAALRNDLAGAEASYRSALRLDPGFAPAWVNLADLYRLQGRDAEGETLLRQAPSIARETASVHHALGLLLVRLGRLDEALPELARAVELAPGEARYAYVYEVALSERRPR